MQKKTVDKILIEFQILWQGRGLRWGDGGGNLTNVQCKPIQNCHMNPPL
jgi:hypothetical protein